ncbi:lysylphosphatidylglycerol synthase domain-containing protein [Demequina sp. SYSU T00068]|uniref:lysylphosphatidylglycerol synthase domain-containing protein n=1 Tax=Demequina lignilytica TaxID=3051663 RepID=UPI0026262CA8|nr:lysylphosphatidylglycerol synthase domain-containing protein [Demequina sp. SYSU T00068]MDN4490832.1 lysylphosphatidylglycerol synthase domain-containing protein [Demequina sp. SYSU T00068]
MADSPAGADDLDASDGSPTPARRAPWWRGRAMRTAVAVAVIGVVAYFFGRSLASNWDNLREEDLSLGWWAVAATVAFVLAVAVSGTLWGRIVRRLDPTPVSGVEAVRVHFSSWLLKYVPGQVGFVLNKVVWGQRRGVSRLVILISVVYENAFLLLGSTIPMVAILALARGGSLEVSGTVWLALAAMVPLAAATHPAVFHRVVSVLGRRTLKRDVPRDLFLPFGVTMRFQAAFLLPRVINGVGIAFIAAALAGAGPESWLPLTAAYAVAGAVGILAVFVPSGLGVREAVFVLFAAPYLGTEKAIVVSLVARVLATVADALIAGVYGILTLQTRKTRQQS